jgi:3-isopropylmalate/(R)-2-methylmalate dehydratase small subunit
MKCVTFDGLGQYAFYDERFDAEGETKPHPLNDPRYAGATILLAGRNFGCGSSREHAPQALYRHGFRAVLAESFAEIFFGNSITLGMPCLVMDGRDIRALAALIDEAPQAEINIDIAGGQVAMADVTFPALLPDHAREALVNGRWDAIADLLEGLGEVRATAAKLPYMQAA